MLALAGVSWTPPDGRTTLAPLDLTELVRCCLFAPELGHTVVYGMSANRDIWWDNSKAAHLGFHPKDSSEPCRAKVEALPAVDPGDPVAVYQGGAFVKSGPFEAP